MLQKQIKNTLLVLLALTLSSISFAAKSKMTKSQIESYQSLSNMPITVVGTYMKHDKQFIYIKAEGAKDLIKVDRKYLLNSPLFLADKEKVSVTLPIGRHLTDNKDLLKKSKSL
jgi:hypothetical protein